MDAENYNLTVLACAAGYHRGGLGQHFSFHVEEVRRALSPGHKMRYFSAAMRPGDEDLGQIISPHLPRLLAKALRFFPGRISHLENQRFDRRVASRLPAGVDRFIGFAGQSLHSFRRARELGCRHLALMAGNSHVNNVYRLHQTALRRYPIERSWMNDQQRRKTLLEYEMADRIYVASDYSMQTFRAEGVSESKLRRIHYPVDPRFTSASRDERSDGVFRIVYVGTITVVKGIPDLLEAFSRFRVMPAELLLIGGTGSRGMRRYVQKRLEDDNRVRLAPGDPLPHVRRADVCVHPSYEDNLAYGAFEAFSAGTKLICTQDTGTKEYIHPGMDGLVVPTGDWRAILKALEKFAEMKLDRARALPEKRVPLLHV